jgi:predicted TIM-barrel fold metal-dependent hydrolase
MGPVVDAHVHLFPPDVIEHRQAYLGRDARFDEIYASPQARMASADELLVEMDRCSVDVSVAAGFPFTDEGLCELVNDYLLEQTALHPEKIAGLACVAPGKPGALAELERCLDAGLRGCGELAPVDWQAIEAVRHGRDGFDAIAFCLRERGLPLLVHASEPVGHAYPGKGHFVPRDCLALAEAYPGLRIVFAHLGGGLFLFETMPEVRAALADVCYDTAAVPYLYCADVYEAGVAAAGSQKFILGSDFPLLAPVRYHESLARLAPEVRRAIDGDNARRVYGL